MDLLKTAIQPLTPPPPDGVSRGCMHSVYPFTAVARDPLGYGVYCRFNWGDGQMSDWTDPAPGGSPHTQAHAWDKPGRYEVRVQAKNTRGVQSAWSPALVVKIEEQTAVDRVPVEERG